MAAGSIRASENARGPELPPEFRIILTPMEVTVMKLLMCVLVAAAVLSGIPAAHGQATQPSQTPTTSPAASPVQPPAAAAQAPIAMTFSPGTLIRVKLDKSIDVKKAKVGDEVMAKTMDDLKSVPPGLALKGCEVIGHVVEATQHQGNSPSTLRIVFDKMVLKNGNPMPLPAFIKAVGYADQFNPSTDQDMSTQMGGARQSQGVGGPPVSTNSGGGNPNLYGGGRMPMGDNTSPLGSDAKLPYNAKGAIGMSGTTIGEGTAQDTVLTSQKKNVKLESGMQMILKTQ